MTGVVRKLKLDVFFSKKNGIYLASNPYLWLKNQLTYPVDQLAEVAERSGGSGSIEKTPNNKRYPENFFGLTESRTLIYGLKSFVLPSRPTGRISKKIGRW